MSPPAGRRLGPASAAGLVVANMIGAGVFTTSGFALADLGTPERVLLAWAIGGAIALCGALSYGALARRIPESGGEYTFLSRIVHPLAGFLSGWVSLLAGFTAPIAAAALGFHAYLSGVVEIGARPEWTASETILVAGAMHGLRSREGLRIQNLAVVLKLVSIAALVAIGLAWLPTHSVAPAPALDLSAFAVTLVWISFAYSGWNAVVYVAGEVRDPDRNVPRAMLIATLGVTIAYLGLNAVFVYAAPVEVLAGRADIGAVAAEALGGPTLRVLVSLLVALALFTSISAMVMTGPRVYARMADDGLLPGFLGRVEEGSGAAVALQVLLSIVVVWISDLATLLGYIGFTLGLSAAAAVSALMLLRHREGAASVPVPGYPWIPGTFILAPLSISVAVAMREPAQALAGLATAATGIPLYLVMRARPRRAG